MVAFADRFTIFGILGFRALGDFVFAVTVCAYIKRKKRNSVLLVYAQDDRPYKRQVLELCPDIDDKVLVSGPGIPLDWLDISGGNPNAAPQVFVDKGFAHANFLVGPKMIMDINNKVGSEFFRCLRFPEEMAEELTGKLVSAGASADRWIVCLHARQSNYEFRNFYQPDRTVDPAPYFQLADYVIDELGGQVVRLGDPSMTPAPARPHLIDLSRDKDNFLLQAYALGRSRFAVVTDSGMLSVANALGVPFATTNVTMLDNLLDGFRFHPWHDQHVILTKNFFARDAVPGNSSEFGVRTDFELCVMFDNGLQELRAIADHMMAKTSDCQGWRDSYIEGSVEAADTISFPFPSVPTSPNWFKPPWWEVSPELASSLVELRKKAMRDASMP